MKIARRTRPVNRRCPAWALLALRCATLLLLACSGIAHAQPLTCEPPLTRMLRAELFFGRNLKVGGSIGESAWASFLAQEVTPRFPQGLTVVDAAGQWRNAASRVIRERSKVLLVVAPDESDTRTRLQAVRDAYARRFRQQSVGLVTQAVCAAF
ncbi:MAG: hypothetical protein QOD74_1014 [Variibacter sp.]|jgi:hypothetical protein|nr:hypothetical protein [Variibacter sp.]